MTDGAALLRSVLTFPEEDTPRLVLADYLDEQGEHDRAEFVRVQVGLATMFCAGCRPDFPCRFAGQCRKKPKQARERSLWATAGHRPIQHPVEWFDVPGWACLADVGLCRLVWTVEDYSEIVADISRGFVSRIELPVAAFLTHAKAIFAAQPVTGVVLSDRVPWDLNEEMPAFAWWPAHGGQVENMGTLPRELYAALRAAEHRFGGKIYPSPERAKLALSDACVAYGRRLAGLPPLPALLTTG